MNRDPHSRAASNGETGWPLAWRLLLPLGALALATCIVVTLLIARTISVRMDDEVDARLARLTRTLESSGLLLDGALLGRVRSIAGVEVAIVGPGDELLSTTLEPERARELVRHATADDPVWNDRATGERFRTVTRRGAMLGHGSTATLIVAGSTRATDRLKRDLAWASAAVIASSLVLALVVGLLVVKSATRPLGRLATAAREVGRGALDGRVPAGGGREITTLAQEFNGMVAELARSRAELVRSEKLAAAGKMAAGVAHELRNPLSSIRMNLQLLDRGSEGRLSDQLGEVLSELDRLDLVLGNLLDLTARPRLHPEPDDLNAIVRSALRLTARKLAHLGISVREELADGLPLVRVDPFKAKQAFLNVILNAAEAMPRGGELRVVTRHAAETVAVAFEDSGVGIAGRDTSQLFEPFFSTKAGGAGLGLHMVRNVMEMHGGVVRLAAAGPAGGTRCELEFPLDPAIAARDTRAAEPELV